MKRLFILCFCFIQIQAACAELIPDDRPMPKVEEAARQEQKVNIQVRDYLDWKLVQFLIDKGLSSPTSLQKAQSDFFIEIERNPQLARTLYQSLKEHDAIMIEMMQRLEKLEPNK